MAKACPPCASLSSTAASPPPKKRGFPSTTAAFSTATRSSRRCALTAENPSRSAITWRVWPARPSECSSSCRCRSTRSPPRSSRGIALAQNPESFARIMITRGSGPLGLDPGLARIRSASCSSSRSSPPPPEAYRDGIGAITYRTVRSTDATPAAGAKVANYLTSVLAIREARKHGAREAFIIDGRGRVLEGTTSNVFLVKDGRLVTVPEESGILSGITRAYLLRAAERLGIPVNIRDIREEELASRRRAFHLLDAARSAPGHAARRPRRRQRSPRSGDAPDPRRVPQGDLRRSPTCRGECRHERRRGSPTSAVDRYGRE